MSYPWIPTTTGETDISRFVCPIVVVSVVGMQYYSNAILWPRLSQLLYATGPISRGLYSCVIPLGSICKYLRLRSLFFGRLLTPCSVGGIWVVATHKFKHQRLQILDAIIIQTTCVGVLSTTTIDNPVKSVILTCLVSFCVTIIMMNCFVLIGFGINNQDDM